MNDEHLTSPDGGPISRRALIRSAAIAVGAVALAPGLVFAQAAQGTPPSVITQPPRQWGPGIQPTIYGDPDIIQLDPAFGAYMLGITAMRRLRPVSGGARGPPGPRRDSMCSGAMSRPMFSTAFFGKICG